MQPTRQACTPYLCCRDAPRALDFYAKAFGAVTHVRFVSPDGRIGHAELEIEGSRLYLSDEWPEGVVTSPSQLGGTTFAIHLVVKDVDALTQRAVEAGAQLLRPAENQPYGDRSSVLLDPFGHRWFLATPVEEVSKEELRRRMGPAFLID